MLRFRRLLTTGPTPPPPHWRPSPPQPTTWDYATDAAWKVTVVLLLSATVAAASYSSIGLVALSAQRYAYGNQIQQQQQAADEAAKKASDFVVKVDEEKK